MRYFYKIFRPSTFLPKRSHQSPFQFPQTVLLIEEHRQRRKEKSRTEEIFRMDAVVARIRRGILFTEGEEHRLPFLYIRHRRSGTIVIDSISGEMRRRKGYRVLPVYRDDTAVRLF